MAKAASKSKQTADSSSGARVTRDLASQIFVQAVWHAPSIVADPNAARAAMAAAVASAQAALQTLDGLIALPPETVPPTGEDNGE